MAPRRVLPEVRASRTSLAAEERFAPERWVTRDICGREPWPFADGQFDFAVCAQTLEDVRDPVWACSEPARERIFLHARDFRAWASA